MTKNLSTSPDFGGSSSQHPASQSASSDSHGAPEVHLYHGLHLASSPPSWVSQITAFTWQPLITWFAPTVLTPHPLLVEMAGLVISLLVYSRSPRRPSLRTSVESNIYKSPLQSSSPSPSCSSSPSTPSTGTVPPWDHARHSRSSFNKGEKRMVAGGSRWSLVLVTDPSLGRGDTVQRTAGWEAGSLVMPIRSLRHRVWGTETAAMCTKDLQRWRMNRRPFKAFDDERKGCELVTESGAFGSEYLWCDEFTAFAHITMDWKYSSLSQSIVRINASHVDPNNQTSWNHACFD